MTDHDIIVVGAGPIGSTYATKMAKKGYDVGLYDKKAVIGEPLQCAGLVSVNINQIQEIQKEFILNAVKGAILYSPNKTNITVKKQENAAYVLDRIKYDQHLFKEAETENVQTYLKTKIQKTDTKTATITTQNEEITGKILVVANGPQSITATKLNPNIQQEYFTAIQYTTQKEDMTDNVKVELNTNISPGFIWTIPVDENTQRIGLFTPNEYKIADKILQEKIEKENRTIIKKHYGKIPKYNSNKKITQDKTILLGDSASQIKPTTGGGLISGLTCVDMAVKTTHNSLQNNNIELTNYQKEYENRYMKEFKMQLTVQKILEKLTAEELNIMFEQLQKYNISDIISEYGEMDTQTPLIKQLIKTGLIFKLIPKMASRRLINIWNIH
ncbi:MAG: NAD(P)/FAD-dependent oxidoreductase [Methanobacteriaceae archaeon]|nr:NAD(P)/FAD-dependent oxidoreductase [Methanobacteriaceae archaeon]